MSPAVPAPGEGDHLGAQRGGETMVRRSLPTPVGEPGGAGLPERPSEPADLAGGELQRLGRLGGCDLPPLEQIEEMQAASFLWGQCRLSSSAWVRERTEWLNS